MIKHPLEGTPAAPAPALRWDGPADAAVTVALAHGAGQPPDSPFMAFFAAGLAAAGHRVARFAFPYMAATGRDGVRRPPDRKPVLLACWRAVIAGLGAGPRVIGGKSLGGRIASEIADDARAAGLVCLGYPFHPPSRPERPRIAHLAGLRTPTLIVQGGRDPFGTPDEVAGYPLSPAIRLHWLADGDHGLAPRASSGRTVRQNWEDALAATAAFIAGLGAGR